MKSSQAKDKKTNAMNEHIKLFLFHQNTDLNIYKIK